MTSAFGGQRSIQLSYGCSKGGVYATAPVPASAATVSISWIERKRRDRVCRRPGRRAIVRRLGSPIDRPR